MFHGDFATILLAEKGPNDGLLLMAESMAGDVVGNGEQDERVEYGLELGALLV